MKSNCNCKKYKKQLKRYDDYFEKIRIVITNIESELEEIINLDDRGNLRDETSLSDLFGNAEYIEKCIIDSKNS